MLQKTQNADGFVAIGMFWMDLWFAQNDQPLKSVMRILNETKLAVFWLPFL